MRAQDLAHLFVQPVLLLQVLDEGSRHRAGDRPSIGRLEKTLLLKPLDDLSRDVFDEHGRQLHAPQSITACRSRATSATGDFPEPFREPPDCWGENNPLRCCAVTRLQRTAPAP